MIKAKLTKTQLVLYLTFICFSFICFWIILLDSSKPIEMFPLTFLPLTFIAVLSVFPSVIETVPNNIGATVLVFLLFVRLVVTPLLMCLGQYNLGLHKNINSNLLYSVLLIAYETFLVFFVIFYFSKKSIRKNKIKIIDGHTIGKYEMNKYMIILIVLLFILLIILYITPELLQGYRSVFEIRDKFFSNFEDTELIKKYGTTFVRKLSLVSGNYIMRFILIVGPAYLIMKVTNKNRGRILSLCCCFIPFFFIPGGLARILIYFIILYLLRMQIFSISFIYMDRKTMKILLLAGICILVWWWSKLDSSNWESIFSVFSSRFNAYFSGVANVAGTFNMPNNIYYKTRYFLYDFLGSIPFGSTLFNLTQMRIQEFFNFCNSSMGQIPTTVGMGAYYFGPLLAPIYSVCFAVASVKAGKKAQYEVNPMKRLRYMLMSIYFSLGIIMYNIEIILTVLFSLILPIYIIERFVFKGDRHGK